MVDHVAAALGAVTSNVILSANDELAHTWLPTVTIVRDNFAALGGLAGVEAGLTFAARSGTDAVVVAWDMPFVTGEVLRILMAAGRENGVLAAVPASEAPHGIEPFCGYYSRDLLPALRAALASGQGAAHRFLAATPGVRVVPGTTFPPRPGHDQSSTFMSVNTADDLARARRLASHE